MRYSILILLSLISILAFSNEAIYNGNISVAPGDYFDGFISKEPGVYLGGSNTFPIGSYVEVKMNHTNVSASVKIVRKIAENGKFILVDKSAGEKLGLSDDDTVMVSIIVKKVIPDPSLALDSLEFDPEPELKGASSRIIEDEEPLPESTKVVEPDPSLIATSDSLVEDDLEAPLEEALDIVADDLEEPPVLATEPVTEEVVAPAIVAIPLDDDSLTEEVSEEDLDSVDGSLYDFDDEIVEDTTEESDLAVYEDTEDKSIKDKTVKRIFYLEPADKKPPVGGKADKELVAVTKNDTSTPFIEGHYLQVGIYSSRERLLDGVEKLQTYNIPYEEVQLANGDKKYLLLAGPLLNDEIGVVRLYLKDRGFKDFFRYIKK